MAKNYQKDAQRLLDMSDNNLFLRDIAEYSEDALISLSKIFISYKMENDREGYDSTLSEKISIIRDTRLSKQKVVKSISKVIAKVKEESKQESIAKKPKASTSPASKESTQSKSPSSVAKSNPTNNTPINVGEKFTKNSAIQYMKDMRENYKDEFKEESKQESIAKKPKASTSPASKESTQSKSPSSVAKSNPTNNTPINVGEKFTKNSAIQYMKDMRENYKDEFKEDKAKAKTTKSIVKTPQISTKSSSVLKVYIDGMSPSLIKKMSMGSGGSGSGSSSRTSNISKIDKFNIKETNAEIKRIDKVDKAKFDQAKLDLRNKEADIRAKHVDAIFERTKSNKENVGIKFKQAQELQDKNAQIKRDESDNSHKHFTDRAKLSHDFQIERERIKDKRREQSDEVRVKLTQLAYEHARSSTQDKAEIQLKKYDKSRKQQIHRDLHSMHPAFGLLYGLSQNNQDSKRSKSNDTDGSGGGLSSALGGLAGGGGSLVSGLGAFKGLPRGILKSLPNGLKLGASGLPIIGAAINGISAGLSSGNIGKGLFSFAGSLSGSIIGAAIGSMFVPVIGTAIGAIVGNGIGNILGKQAYDAADDALNGKTPINPATSPSTYGLPTAGIPSAMPSGKPMSKLNSQTSSNTSFDDADKQLMAAYSANEGKTYNTIFGGKEADITNMTMTEARKFQANNANFPKNSKGKIESRVIGKYQMNTDFMDNAIANSGYDPDTTKMTPEVQDKLIMDDLVSRGLYKFADGDGSVASRTKMGNRGAGLLASLPLLSSEAGRYRGDSRYKGVGSNRPFIDAKSHEDILDTYYKNKHIQKAPSKINSLVDSTNNLQDKTMEDKTKPINVVNVGGSSGGDTNIVNNTYVNPVNTDSTVRQTVNSIMMPGRPH